MLSRCPTPSSRRSPRRRPGVPALLSLSLLAAPAACSSPSTLAATPDAQAICPSTVGETAGAACTVEGLVCAPQYACGTTFGIAHCVCTAGTFACTDLTGAALSGPSAAPGCPQSKLPVQRCPVTESAARMAACTELNLVCSYKAPCGGTPGLDRCECSSMAGQTGYVFSCRSPCHPDAGVYTIDSGAAEEDAPSEPEDAAAPQDASDATPSPADASG